MDKLFSLDGRLSVCASLVRNGARLADVGTDHAYLPIWLAKNGKIISAVASDIRKKPLAAGMENIERYGCSEIVSTRLCAGLDDISPDEADDIVIAGMGGEMIAGILENAPWVKDPAKRLILQPMTKAHTLREFLCNNGFEIISETACEHGGKFYTVILSSFCGTNKPVPFSYYYMGRLENDGECTRSYMNNILSKIKKKRSGVACSGKDTSKLDGVIADILAKFPEIDK